MYIKKGVNFISIFGKLFCIFIERREMNKVQMMLTDKMNSYKCNPKNVKRLSTAVTACAFALTLGSIMVLSTPSVNAAGQVIGGYYSS